MTPTQQFNLNKLFSLKEAAPPKYYAGRTINDGIYTVIRLHRGRYQILQQDLPFDPDLSLAQVLDAGTGWTNLENRLVPNVHVKWTIEELHPLALQ